MQTTPPLPLMLPLPLGRWSKFGGYCSMFCLSAVTVYGAWKFAAFYKDVQRHRIESGETRRRQEEELVLLRRALHEKEVELEENQAAGLSNISEIDELQKKVSEIGRELHSAREQNRTLVDRVKDVDSRNQQLEVEVSRVKGEHLEAIELLGIRTAELKGAQAFLTKADQLSGADVIKLVVDLNTEILQTAATVAEGATIQRKNDQGEKELDSEETKEAYMRTEEIVGPRMTELLRISEHHEDPILVQIALQASLSAYTHWIVSSWCFESPEDEHMLSEIYARVRESEEQAVSGRWRQLTRTHLQRMLIQEPDFTSDMADTFSSILITAGFKDSSSVHDHVLSTFSGQISRVMKLAQHLNKHIGEGVTSCDLEALYIAPDVGFDPFSMEDAIAADAVKKTENGGHETILCTTDLGLVRAEKVSGTLGDWHEQVLLRPKVVLYSGLVAANGSAE